MTMKKKLLIIGASGFIGTELQKGLINFNISTQRGRDIQVMSIEDLADKISGYEIVINLAGKSVFNLWTRKNKENIYRSRIETTERIAKALNICDNPPEMYIQASAVGIYKPETLVSENNHLYDQGFMAKVVYDWEKATELIDTGRVEVTILRLGIVLGRKGGAYKTLRLLTRLNLGGYFDGGKQALSFIWVKDLIRAMDFIVEKKITGVVNIVSPEITNYKELMLAMRKQLKPLIIWPLPSFVLKIILGEASEILLKGQKVIPDVLLKNSFNFEASDVNTCVKKLESS
jgi:uncharacterized protein (TIGR01777 family)